MARIVETHMIPILTLSMFTSTKDGRVVLHEFKEGDMVENLRYIKNGDVKTITGRLSKINYFYRHKFRTYTSIAKLRAYFGEDTPVTSIEIDASEQYHSNVVTITANDIVEFLPDIENAVKVWFELKYSVKMIIELSDNTENEFIINETDAFNKLTYVNDDGDDIVNTVYFKAVEYTQELIPTRFICIVDGKIRILDPLKIKNVEDQIPMATTIEDINNAINESVSGIVTVDNHVFNDTVEFTKDVVIRGTHADANLNFESSATITDITTFTGKLNFAPNIKVELNGLALTKDAFLHIVNVKELTLKNCIIRDLKAYQAKSYAIQTSGDTSIKMSIRNCYFGDNILPKKDDNSGKMFVYNFFELNQKLENGSEFISNYFSSDAHTHNTINIYDVVDDAIINIKNNTWEYSANGIRIGTKGAAKCTINIEKNKYLKTDEKNPDWAGLFFVQPYGKVTTDMSGVVINAIDNIHNDDCQLYYIYAGPNDMQFTEENSPVINVG